MRGAFFRRTAAAVMFLSGVAVIAVGVGWYAFNAALDGLAERGRADLALAADRLAAQLQRYREVAVFLSDHPVVTALVLEGGPDAAAEELLRETADKTGAAGMMVLDAGGREMAAVGAGRGDSGLAPAFARAMTGALGAAHYVDERQRRLYVYSAPVFEPGGPARGAIVVALDLAEIEVSWPASPSPVFFTDEAGIVFATNRSDLVLSVRGGPVQAPYLRAFPPVRETTVNGYELWTMEASRYLPRRALHLAQEVPVIGMTGEILLDISSARRIAILQGAVVAALFLAFGLALFLAAERRRALAERLAVEAAANAELEARVQARTRELSQANVTLQREVREREETAAALRKAQAELVQAGKLSALGQMSAGISHELNQPLMAIRSFAENAERFLARGRPETAAENLRRISDLARRMGRIIKNLRAFARQESETITDVDLVAVVEAVLELAGPRLAEAGVVLRWQPPAGPVMARGGEVRLQQVVMNLVSNAIDAMSDSDRKEIDINLVDGETHVMIEVCDTGPGIAEPDRIFDPFYSTKEVGKAEGMGLGLSISYGLVQSFGGNIRGRNRKQGGAVFTVELARSPAERAA